MDPHIKFDLLLCTVFRWPVQSQNNDANDVILVSSFLTLNIFHTFLYCFYCWLCNSEIQVFKKNLLSTLTYSYKESTFTKKCISWPYWNLLEHLNFNIWAHLNLVYILRSFSILDVLSQNIFSRIEYSWHIFYNITDITKVIHSTNNQENSFKLIMQFPSTKHTKKPSSK